VQKGIGVIAWGSLVWNPGGLAIESEWHKDGPFLPIEFARISSDGRLTLVLLPGAANIQTCWALSSMQEIEDAVANLNEREGCHGRDCVGIWSVELKRSVSKHPGVLDVVARWGAYRGLKAAIWTDLGSNLEKRTGNPLTLPGALAYLKSLDEDQNQRAAEYIIKAPPQTTTTFRPQLEAWAGKVYSARA